MARRKRVSETEERDLAQYEAFGQAQLRRPCTSGLGVPEQVVRTEPFRVTRFIRDWPGEAQERFIDYQARCRKQWAGPDDWTHRLLEKGRN